MEEVEQELPQATLWISVPEVADWRIEYSIDHKDANFRVSFVATFDDVSYRVGDDLPEDEDDFDPLNWSGSPCHFRINELFDATEVERRRTDESIGYGQRKTSGAFFLSLCLTREEFRDLVSVLKQDHAKHEQRFRDDFVDFMAQFEAELDDKELEQFGPRESPRIRVDIFDICPNDMSDIDVFFRVRRIAA